MRRVARGDLPPTARVHRTGRSLAFGRMDRLSPGYREALEIAREHGYEPVERMAGGRAAVFHEGTIAFSKASKEPALRTGTGPRFEEMAAIVAGALQRLGLDARVGEVPGEYCPGEWSINFAGRTKLAGIGQRVIAGGAHVGGVLVFRGADEIREVLVPSTRRSGSSGTRRPRAASRTRSAPLPRPPTARTRCSSRSRTRSGRARRALRPTRRRDRRDDDANGRGAARLPHAEAAVAPRRCRRPR